MKTLGIITATYNREKEIKKLYNSLCNQTMYDFNWYIIDDGSTDNTKNLVKEFKNSKFQIKYIYKKNGGKHTALNLAFEIVDTELVIIVDSDDYLINNAVEIICKKWNKYCNEKKIAGLVFKKKDVNNKNISENFKADEFEENYNNYVINGGIKGDKAEVFKSNIIKKYKYPEFKNEKFMGEGVIWSKISRNYNMIFVNKSIVICEYLEDGLTKSGRRLRINNPRGGMFHSKEYLDKRYRIKIREKNALLFLTYARFAKLNTIALIKKSRHKFILLVNVIPSLFLFMYWKRKYK